MKKILSKIHTKSKLAITLLAFLVVFTPVYYTHAETNFFEQLLFDIIVNAFGGLMGMCAIVLNFAVDAFIVNFGQKFNGGALFDTVGNLWTIVRDFFNLTFIFGLVYLGFTMILKGDNSNTRRWLVTLVIAALLVNFSLLISKVIIDSSNIVATQILNAGLETANGNGKTVFIRNPNEPTQVGFADSMMVQMGLTTWFGMGNTAGSIFSTDSSNDHNKTFMMSMMIMITFTVAGFVFLSAGILIIIRGAMLLLFMILSPVMFIGFVLPNFSNIASEYWRQFLGRAFFAPIYILMTYISLVMAGSVIQNANISNVVNAQNLQQTIDMATLFGQFALLIVLLVASLTIAKKLGADGAGQALSIGNKLQRGTRRRVVGATRNTARFAATQTAGRGARFVSEKAGNTLNRTLRSAQQLEGKTFVGKTLKGLARTRAVEGAVGGTAASMQNAKFGMKNTRSEERKIQNDINERADRGATYRKNNKVPPVNAASTAADIAARQEARRALQADVSDMSKDEILERARNNKAGLMDAEFASLLTDSQVKALEESGILTGKELEELQKNRDEGALADILKTLENGNASTENLNTAMESLNRLMSTMSNERLQKMDPSKLTNQVVASRLSQTQLDNLRDSGRVSSANMVRIKDARDDGFKTIIKEGSLGNPASLGGLDAKFQDKQRRGLFRNSQDAGKLPVDVLAATASQQYLTPRIIEEFLNTNPDNLQIGLVRRNIEDYVASGKADPGVIATWKNWTRTQVSGRRFGLTI